MNFTRKFNLYPFNIYNNIVGGPKKDDKSKEEMQNLFNLSILDSIIDDDDEKFSELITQSGDVSNINQQFTMTSYKLPRILRNKPSYASLCAFFCAEKCLQVLSMLVPAGLESEQINQKDEFNRSPIHFACAGGSLNIIREFDQAGYSFDIKDREGCLPSHYASMAGHLDVIKYLWTKGADIMSSSNIYASMTPLHVACLYGNLDVVKFICETVVGEDEEDKGNNNDKNYKDIGDGKDMKLNHLLNFSHFHNCYCRNSTPLHLACEGGHADVLKYLLSKKDLVKIQINSLDRFSCTPLLIACQNGSLECIRALIEAGVKLDIKNRKHLPLIDATAAGHIDIVRFLLKQREIKIERENSQKLDALSVAIMNDNLEIAKCLIENKAMSKYNDDKIGGLLINAFKTNNFDLVAYLDRICKVPYKKKSNMKAHYWSCSHSMKMDGSYTWGTLFMQQAVMLENEKMVDFLLKKNVTFDKIDFSVNFKMPWGTFMDFLVDQGLDLSKCMNSEGVPPIVAAIKHGNLDNIKKLISKGAKLNKEIIIEYDCILEACSVGKDDLFEFLMGFGPEITNGEKCIQNLLFSYNRRNIKQRKIIAKKLLQAGVVDLNKPFHDQNNENLVSLAVFHKSLEYLELFSQFGADFENVPLKYDQLCDKQHFSVFQFLVQHGCKFNNPVKYTESHYWNRNGHETPLEQSLSQMHLYQFDIKIPLLLIDYIDENEINRIKTGDENIIDRFLVKNCYEGILKIFQKCNCVVYPKSSKDDFLNIINSCGNQDLIDFVRKNK